MSDENKLPPGLKDDFYREFKDPFKESIFEPSETRDDKKKYWLTDVGLSPREIEVAMLVDSGKRNKEIASLLFVTEKTVKFHLTNIYNKVRLKSRHQLIYKLNEVSR